jgi:hypothetical protein
MFAKSKITKSMIDAVNSVLGEEPVEQKEQLLNEASMPIKEPTSTGMRVYGRSYGNSAKAKQDQTKSSVDDLKGPKTKELMQKDKEEYMKTKGKYDEELKGNQDKIDANHNDKIDAQDFAILRGKKKVKEEMTFAKKLLEKVKLNIQEKKDVVMPEGMNRSDIPAVVRKARGDAPLTPAEVKSGSKDSISDPKNLAKARNEEIELDEDGPGRKWRQGPPLLKSRAVDSNMHDAEAKHPDEKRTWVARGYDGDQKEPVQRAGRNKEDPLASRANIKSASKGTAKTNRTLKQTIKSTLNKEDVSEYELDEMINEVLSKDATAGEWIHDFVHSDNPKFAGKSKAERKKMALGAYYGAQKEAYEASNAPITTDTLAGRLPGGKSNSFKSYKLRVKPLAKETGENETPEIKIAEKTPARTSIKAEGVEVDEATIAGTPGWKKMSKDIKDKSGAVHTPMSRAKDLARTAMKRVKSNLKDKK